VTLACTGMRGTEHGTHALLGDASKSLSGKPLSYDLLLRLTMRYNGDIEVSLNCCV
jgi:hypothetical protein